MVIYDIENFYIVAALIGTIVAPATINTATKNHPTRQRSPLWNSTTPSYMHLKQDNIFRWLGIEFFKT